MFKIPKKVPWLSQFISPQLFFSYNFAPFKSIAAIVSRTKLVDFLFILLIIASNKRRLKINHTCEKYDIYLQSSYLMILSDFFLLVNPSVRYNRLSMHPPRERKDSYSVVSNYFETISALSK